MVVIGLQWCGLPVVWGYEWVRWLWSGGRKGFGELCGVGKGWRSCSLGRKGMGELLCGVGKGWGSCCVG